MLDKIYFFCYNIEKILYEKTTMDNEKILKCMKALADPVRLEIFNMLRGGTLCACKILERFAMTQPTLSYHMKLLTESGLVVAKRDWKWSYYSVDERAAEEIGNYFKHIEKEK